MTRTGLRVRHSKLPLYALSSKEEEKNRWVLRIRSRFGELENNISCAGTRKSCNFVYILFREKVMISILAMFVFCTFDLTFKSKLRLSKSRGRPTSERFPNRKIDTKTGLLAFLICLIRSRPSLARHVWRWMLFTVTLMSWKHKKNKKNRGNF